MSKVKTHHTAESSIDRIVLDQVYKSYKIESHVVEALRGVHLKVKSGTVAAVCGKSGAGKSTLLHVIGTLDSPNQGKVFLNGSDVTKMSDATLSQFRNRTIGFVFQMHNLLPEFTALENVMMPGLIAGASQVQVRDRAMKLLQAVEMERRFAHRPGELSGGEQQRVAIARALIMAPSIILADEPTGNLDQKTSQAVQELLLNLCANHGVTMLLVTHDEDLAAKLPARIQMEDGRIVEAGGLLV